MAEKISRQDPILEFPLRWRRQKFLAIAIEAALRLAGWVLAAAAVLVECDRLFSPGHALRWGVWWAMVASLAAALWFFARESWRACQWSAIFAAVQETFPGLHGYLRPAWDLLQAPEDPATSRELKEAHLESTRRLLRGLLPKAVFKFWPTRAAKRAAVQAAAAGILSAAFLMWSHPTAGLLRVFMPWTDKPLEAFLSLSPGDAQIGWGQSALISASWAPTSLVARAPQDIELWVEDQGGWRQAPWDRQGVSSAEFLAENLTSPLSYKMSWRGLSTRAYALKPIPVPSWQRLDLKVEGLNQDETVPLDGSQSLEFLTGSQLTIMGTPSEAISKAEVNFSSPAASLPMSRMSQAGGAAGLYAASFHLTQNVRFTFALEALDGRQSAPGPEYSITALAHDPPMIEMLSPQAPVAADVGGAVPISYAAQDDGGIVRVALVVRGSGLGETEKIIRTFDSPPKDQIGDYAWSLAAFPAGRLEFRLKAYNNAVPAQTSFSGWQIVTIANWRKIRQDETGLWNKTQSRLDALAPKENQYADALGKSSQSAGKTALSESAQSLSQNWRALARDLDGLLAAQAQDPAANPGIKESLSDFARAAHQAAEQSAPKAESDVHQGDYAAAQSIHQGLASLAAQGQSLLKAGRQADQWRSASENAQSLSLSAASFLGDVARAASTSSEVSRRELEQKLSRIEQQLGDLAQKIQSLASAAPAASQASAAQNIPLQSAMDAASSLQAALASGDVESAKRLADELSRDLSQISQDLQGASSGAMSAAEQAAMGQAEAASSLWSKVVAEQETARDAARELDFQRRAKRVARQKDILAALEQEQSALVFSAGQEPSFPSPALDDMKSVEGQFASRQVADAPERLQNIIDILRAQSLSENSPHPNPLPEGEGRGEGASIASGEEDVLKRLRKAQEEAAAKPDAASAAQAGQQGLIRAETKRLGGNLRDLKESGFELPSQSLQNISQAQAAQAQAQDALLAGDVQAAQSHQDKALSLLSSGENEMSGGLSGREKVFSLGSSAGAGGLLSNEPSGTRTGLVPLPSAKDYLPPDVLRGELEESLGEKKPKAYAPIIQEYFERLAQ